MLTVFFYKSMKKVRNGNVHQTAVLRTAETFWLFIYSCGDVKMLIICTRIISGVVKMFMNYTGIMSGVVKMLIICTGIVSGVAKRSLFVLVLCPVW